MFCSRMLFSKKIFFRLYMIHAVVALISWVAPFFSQLLCRKSQTARIFLKRSSICQVSCLIGSLNDHTVIAVFLFFCIFSDKPRCWLQGHSVQLNHTKCKNMHVLVPYDNSFLFFKTEHRISGVEAP